MTKWLSLLFLTIACSAPRVDERPSDVILTAAVSEPVLESKLALEPAVRTLCATVEALEVEPRLNDLLRAALDYWGTADWDVPETGRCDVEVSVPAADWDYWEEHPKAIAVAQMGGELRPGECRPEALFVNVALWGLALDNGWEQTVISHEVGHLLCFPHVLDDAEDLMSPAAGMEFK